MFDFRLQNPSHPELRGAVVIVSLIPLGPGLLRYGRWVTRIHHRAVGPGSFME